MTGRTHLRLFPDGPLIKGVIAAGTVASSAAYLFRTTTMHGQPAAAGAVERLITLNVNGQERRVDVMTQETLAMTLRYKLGLTGTKIGCDRAECGACTRARRRRAALLVLVPDASRARQEGRRQSKASPMPPTGKLSAGAAGRGRRAGIPVRVLHARFRDGGHRLSEDQSEPDAAGAGARRFRAICAAARTTTRFSPR